VIDHIRGDLHVNLAVAGFVIGEAEGDHKVKSESGRQKE